ncbi:MAG: DUF4148 domain-containing protein [Microbacteriaceae bacterium]|nr:DUF4148 domain-containing protein [Burkholderiaceae bacterium]
MNKLTVITACLLFAGLSPLAQAQDSSTAATTRAQVVAELQEARDSGQLALQYNEIGVDGYLRAPAKVSTATAGQPITVKGSAATPLSRADVLAELKRARASGELDVIQNEGGPSNYAVAVGRVDANAPVVAGKPRSAQ